MSGLILIDGMHLLYRQWHTFSKFSNSKGYPTGVVFGVMRTLEMMRKRYPSHEIFYVKDGSPAKRKNLLGDYKQGRGETTAEVYLDTTHFDVDCLILALGLSIVFHPDYEADDSIAVCAQSVSHLEPVEVLIYSGDDDFSQLCTQNPQHRVSIWKPKVGKGVDDIFTYDTVKTLWGVPPEQLPLYRSIEGDVSDKIKGLPRVPRKALQEAVAKEGAKNPQEFYDSTLSLAYFTPEWRQRLLEFRPQCELNYRITKLPFEPFTPSVQRGMASPIQLKQLFEKLEFKSYLAKFDQIVTLFSGVSDEQVSNQPV